MAASVSALTAVVSCYRARGAVREVGKVLGVPEDVTGALSGLVWGWSTEGVSEREVKDLNLNLDDPRLRLTLELARELIGAPRHLSQHPGGFVLTQDRLDDLVPIEPAAMENRQVIEWDKNDIEIAEIHEGRRARPRHARLHAPRLRSSARSQGHSTTTWPRSRRRIRRPMTMIRKADTVGVFQIESRAQMAMLPRMKPTNLLRSRHRGRHRAAGADPGRHGASLYSPARRAGERVLSDAGARAGAGQDARRAALPGAGDAGRHRMRRLHAVRGGSAAAFDGDVQVQGRRLEVPATSSSRACSSAATTRNSPSASSSSSKASAPMAFPESHAASFALIAYASSWMKCHHPDVFCCALLNAQPMGFYAPAQLVRDAQQHGVEIRPVDINHSRWDCTLEPARRRAFAVRLGLRMAKGLSNADGAAIALARGDTPFESIEDIWRRAGVPVAALERLAEADAFGSLGLNRRDALWAHQGPWRRRRCRFSPRPTSATACCGRNPIEPRGVADADDAGPRGGGGLSVQGSHPAPASGGVPAAGSRGAAHAALRGPADSSGTGSA